MGVDPMRSSRHSPRLAGESVASISRAACYEAGMLRHLVPFALAAALGSGSTCSSETSTPPPGGTGTASPPGGSLAAETSCVDAWLEKNKMDQYGNAAGTMYMGGTPLFDEASGKSMDRLEYIYKNHPDVKVACHR